MELRRSPRFPVHCPIVFYRNDTRREGTMINVSMSGCGVESATRLQRGNYVVLRIHLPDQAPPIQVLAVVRWTREQRFRVEFLDLRPEDQERLRRFIETLTAGRSD